VNYGKALRIARAIAGLQQQELADLADMNSSHISLIEKEKRKPSADALERLCKALQVPAHLFMLLGAERSDLRIAAQGEIQRAGESLALLLFDNAPRRNKRARRKQS
jgi:transcriptional regulator with XRE-family HTH domain